MAPSNAKKLRKSTSTSKSGNTPTRSELIRLAFDLEQEARRNANALSIAIMTVAAGILAGCIQVLDGTAISAHADVRPIIGDLVWQAGSSIGLGLLAMFLRWWEFLTFRLQRGSEIMSAMGHDPWPVPGWSKWLGKISHHVGDQRNGRPGPDDPNGGLHFRCRAAYPFRFVRSRPVVHVSLVAGRIRKLAGGSMEG